MRYQLLTLIFLAFVSVAKADFTHETYISGQGFITTIAISPNGRMYFILKNSGDIKVVQGPNSVRPQPFFHFNVNNSGERGGLGLTFHPDYPDSPYVYAYVTIPQPVLANVVVRLVDSLGYGTHPDTIFRAPITTSADNHNGGNIRFGPDNKLYVTIGENNNPLWAQDTCRVQGKIDRINYDGSIPDDNPIHCAPIYAYGLRNSYDFCFHPVTGALYASENGPDANDEVNLILPGRNYGWPIVQCESSDLDYVNALWCWTPTIAPTGIIIPSNCNIPEFNNKILMTDYNTGTLHLMSLNSAGDSILTDDHIYNIGFGLIDVDQGPDGDIYLTTSNGAIVRLIPTGQPTSSFPLYHPNQNGYAVFNQTRFIWGELNIPGQTPEYHLEFAADSNFAQPIFSLNVHGDTSMALYSDSLENFGMTMFWRVSALDDTGHVTFGGEPQPEHRRLNIVVTGDANGNGVLNGVDVVYFVNYLKGIGPAPNPVEAGDANGDCNANGIDVSFLVNYFKGGAEPFRGNCE
jgi:aldose sugar dehydrogenase